MNDCNENLKPSDDLKTYVKYGKDNFICITCEGEMIFSDEDILTCKNCNRIGIFK